MSNVEIILTSFFLTISVHDGGVSYTNCFSSHEHLLFTTGQNGLTSILYTDSFSCIRIYQELKKSFSDATSFLNERSLLRLFYDKTVRMRNTECRGDFKSNLVLFAFICVRFSALNSLYAFHRAYDAHRVVQSDTR